MVCVRYTSWGLFCFHFLHWLLWNSLLVWSYWVHNGLRCLVYLLLSWEWGYAQFSRLVLMEWVRFHDRPLSSTGGIFRKTVQLVSELLLWRTLIVYVQSAVLWSKRWANDCSLVIVSGKEKRATEHFGYCRQHCQWELESWGIWKGEMRGAK